ncbi:MAG: response regulator [bacterium]
MSLIKKINPDYITILIVEDSHTQALKLQNILQEIGYIVMVALNGKEAMVSLKKERPNIVISDIVMPDMNGYELCRQIKADEKLKNIPVLLLTTLSEPEDIIKGLDCGADSFLIKPYEREQLLSHIQYILINNSMRSEIGARVGIEIFFAGKKHFINPERIQILDLLLSSYENVLHQKREQERLNKELNSAGQTIKTLQGILPICANCKKIRDENDHWHSLEEYIQQRSNAAFSHSICPECKKILYPEYV